MASSLDEMIGMYLSWPRQLRDGFARGSRAGLEWSPGPGSSIVFCGMGGSGIVGDIVSAVLGGAGIRVHTVKGPRLPAWAGPGDLVVAVSYSGNTWETLECARDALTRGLQLAAIASGGRLAELARSHGFPLVGLPKGYYPRAALAQMTGSSLGLLSVLHDASSELEEAASRMEGTPVEEAKRVAGLLSQAQVVSIVACGSMAPAARRIRSELAENSKVVAREEVYPEAGHNDIVSWQALAGLKPGFLALSWSGDSWCSRLVDRIVERVYRGLGPVYLLGLDSPSLLSALLEASLFGGLASVYLAGARGVDPGDTSLIREYRGLLEELAGGSVG